MLTITGYIPKSITYIQHKSRVEDATKKPLVFPIDAANIQTRETAINWAAGYQYSSAHEPIEIHNEENIIDSVVLVNLDVRSQGGRAYKVIIHDKYAIDMREDVLLDCIKHKGIQAGGRIIGPFIFAVIGSQMKIILKDSELYRSIYNSDNKKTLKKIGITKLQVSHLYSTRNETYGVYLGKHTLQNYTDIYTYVNKMVPELAKLVIIPDKIYVEERKSGHLIADIVSAYRSTRHIHELDDIALLKAYYGTQVKRTSSYIVDHGAYSITLDMLIANNTKDFFERIDKLCNVSPENYPIYYNPYESLLHLLSFNLFGYEIPVHILNKILTIKHKKYTSFGTTYWATKEQIDHIHSKKSMSKFTLIT